MEIKYQALAKSLQWAPLLQPKEIYVIHNVFFETPLSNPSSSSNMTSATLIILLITKSNIYKISAGISFHSLERFLMSS